MRVKHRHRRLWAGCRSSSSSVAVLDAFDLEQRVGDLRMAAPRPRHEHLKAMVMVQVHMHPGHDVPLKIMLNMDELSGGIGT